MGERRGGRTDPEAAEIRHHLSQENGKGNMGRERRESAVLDLSLEPQAQSSSWGQGGRGDVSSVTGWVWRRLLSE